MSSRKIKKRIIPPNRLAGGGKGIFVDAMESRAQAHAAYVALLEPAKAHAAEDRFDLAIELMDRVLALDANYYDALDLKRKCLHMLARTEDEVPIMQQMLALRPNLALHSLLLFYLLYLGTTTPESLYEESRRWFELYGEPVARRSRQPHGNDPDPKRKIKIAYVSPDLRHHTIMKLLPPVFEFHDREQFAVSFYSTEDGVSNDKVSDYIAQTNRVIAVPPEAEAIAAQARADGIDILVDLAGHTMGAAAHLVFAMKPAPVQVSWMGVMSTTGMRTIDYYIGDAYSPCPGTEQFFSETVYRLPRISGSYRPAADVGIAEAPFFKNGFITFGSFNNPLKITRDTVRMWSAILHLAPNSRLFFKFLGLEKPIVQDRFLSWFREDGIAAERIRFEGGSAALEYLCKWSEVDISLDPYPYNGGTTTLDALWMGVPVVTLAGRLAVSCTGINTLAALGFPAALTAEQYIQTAMFLVENIPKTPGMRRAVRQALERSALMDERGLIRALETAYREMWVKWCAGRN